MVEQSEELLNIYKKKDGTTATVLDESEKNIYKQRITFMKNALHSLQG
jgi:hypothetical protein